MRIRNIGYRVARIEGRMAVKFTENRQSIREVWRRSRTGMYDYGAVIRYAGVYGGAVQFCLVAIPFVVSSVAIALFFLLAAPLALYFGFAWLILALVVVLGAAIVIRKGGFHAAALSMAVRIATTYKTIKSFLCTKPKPIEDYPTDVIQVR